MWAFLRPIFSYRKFLLANKILSNAHANFVTFAGVTDDNGKEFPAYDKHYLPFFASAFFKHYPNTKPERFLESLEILIENKEVSAEMNTDIYKIRYKCTALGERVLNDGTYLTMAYKRVGAIIGGLLGILSIISGAIIKYLPELIKLLHK